MARLAASRPPSGVLKTQIILGLCFNGIKDPLQLHLRDQRDLEKAQSKGRGLSLLFTNNPELWDGHRFDGPSLRNVGASLAMKKG